MDTYGRCYTNNGAPDVETKNNGGKDTSSNHTRVKFRDVGPAIIASFLHVDAGINTAETSAGRRQAAAARLHTQNS